NFDNIPESFYGVVNADTFLWSILGTAGKAYFDKNIIAVHNEHAGGIWSKKSTIYKLRNRIDTHFKMYHNSHHIQVRVQILKKLVNYNLLLAKIYLKSGKHINSIKALYVLLKLWMISCEIKIKAN